MATKLYVGNLPFQTTSDDLRDHFAQAGNVESAQVVEDRMTGRSRGFGFVEMTTAEEAAAAIEQFNGKVATAAAVVAETAAAASVVVAAVAVGTKVIAIAVPAGMTANPGGN